MSDIRKEIITEAVRRGYLDYSRKDNFSVYYGDSKFYYLQPAYQDIGTWLDIAFGQDSKDFWRSLFGDSEVCSNCGTGWDKAGHCGCGFNQLSIPLWLYRIIKYLLSGNRQQEEENILKELKNAK